MEATEQVKKFKEFLEHYHNIKPKDGLRNLRNPVTSVTSVTPFVFLDGKEWLHEAKEEIQAKKGGVTCVTLKEVTEVTEVTPVTGLRFLETKHKLTLCFRRDGSSMAELIAVSGMTEENIKIQFHRYKDFFIVVGDKPKRYQATPLAQQETENKVIEYFNQLNAQRKKIYDQKLTEIKEQEKQAIIPLYVELLEQVRKGNSFIDVDFSSLARFNPSLAEDLLNTPEETLKAMEISTSELDLENISPKFKIRFYNLPKSRTLDLGDVRPEHLGKLWRFEATVSLHSDVRPQVTSARFECPSCGNIINMLQTAQKFNEPTKCGCGRKGKFRLVSKELVAAQGLVLEEISERLDDRDQRKMNAILMGDLTNSEYQKYYEAGDPLVFNGIIKEILIPLRSGGFSTKLDLIVEVLSVEFKNIVERLSLSEDDKKEIKKILKNPDVINQFWLTNFACHIHGCENQKKAAILSMASATKQQDKIGDRTLTLNVLMVGDPSTGKSDIIKEVNKKFPGNKAIVSNMKTSIAGLIGTTEKNELLGTYSIKKGVFAKVHGGCLGLDELDKWNDELLDKLHHVLQNQTADINQAREGHYKTIWSCVAGCNPKDSYLTDGQIDKQLHFKKSLLTRFDLILAVRDEPDITRDKKIAKTFFKMCIDSSDALLFKKAMYYIIHYLNPNVTHEAEEYLTEWYAENRQRVRPRLVHRHANTLKKLCICFARLHGCDKADINHAKEATSMFMDAQASYFDGLISINYDTIEKPVFEVNLPCNQCKASPCAYGKGGKPYCERHYQPKEG